MIHDHFYEGDKKGDEKIIRRLSWEGLSQKAIFQL
jgi:hypothetical protein